MSQTSDTIEQALLMYERARRRLSEKLGIPNRMLVVSQHRSTFQNYVVSADEFAQSWEKLI